MSTPIWEKRTFHTPAFRIRLAGRDTGQAVIADVQEVTFTDDIDAIDSFEFTLSDWDPVQRLPRYSSPWDASGRPLSLFEGGPEVPNFEPGAKVALLFGYLEDGELPVVMEGEVVSIAPTFPASGAPTCRVRALNAFLRRLQKTEVSGNYDGTDKEIVQKLCAENNVTVQWSAIEHEGEPHHRAEVEGTLLAEIEKRAKTSYGLSITTLPPENGTGDPILFLYAGTDLPTRKPVADLTWGRTLISFTPALSAAGQISSVVVRAGDPNADGGERRIEVTRTWADIGLRPSALGPAGHADIETAVKGTREILKPDHVSSREDAMKAADGRLRELARQLITASGSTIGLPELRAGEVVTLTGLGARFDGRYSLTKATHTIGANGYTTSFDGRKQVLDT